MVVTHVRGGESLTCKVGNPIMELVGTNCDEAYLIAVEVMENKEFCSIAVAMVLQVRGIYAVVQEEGIP